MFLVVGFALKSSKRWPPHHEVPLYNSKSFYISISVVLVASVFAHLSLVNGHTGEALVSIDSTVTHILPLLPSRTYRFSA